MQVVCNQVSKFSLKSTSFRRLVLFLLISSSGRSVFVVLVYHFLPVSHIFLCFLCFPFRNFAVSTPIWGRASTGRTPIYMGYMGLFNCHFVQGTRKALV